MTDTTDALRAERESHARTKANFIALGEVVSQLLEVTLRQLAELETLEDRIDEALALLDTTRLDPVLKARVRAIFYPHEP